MDVKLVFFRSPPADVTVIDIALMGLGFRPRSTSRENLAGVVVHENLEIDMFSNDEWGNNFTCKDGAVRLIGINCWPIVPKADDGLVRVGFSKEICTGIPLLFCNTKSTVFGGMLKHLRVS